MKSKEIVKSILWVIYIILIVYISYQVLLVILGGSWAIEEIIMSGIGLIISGIFSIFALLAVQSGKLGKIEERTNYLLDMFKNHERRIISIEKRN